jgi:uncharacterized protein (DUF924 family)
MLRPMTPTADDVLQFWFEHLPPASWWRKSPALDAEIGRRFGALHAQAARAELAHWRDSPPGRLAEVIVLDQFSRNLWRDSPTAFAQDTMALILAQEAVRQGADAVLPVVQRSFLYMPYMHSESVLIQAQSLALFGGLGLPANLDSAQRHHDIVARFGRYPHRNAVLGRTSTAEELLFLQQPGSSF